MSHNSEQKKFQAEFSAKEYLQNYYEEPDLAMVETYVTQAKPASETMRIMMFLDTTCKPCISAVFDAKEVEVLELGGGPTLYQLMNVVDEVKEIHFTDYVEGNLDEVRAWKNKDSSAFSWKKFSRAALMIKKDITNITDAEIESLEEELRNKITEIKHCDIFKEDLGIAKKSYNIINTHFVAESATSSKDQWQIALNNIYNKLNDKGLLFMSALRGAKETYKVLDKQFPAVELYETDLKTGLENAGFHVIRISSIHSEDRSNEYEGFMFVVAQKK